MTSANPNTTKPLGPDFTFHLEYHRNKVKIFEEHGGGCIYRISIFPPFSGRGKKIHLLTPGDIKNIFLEIQLDDVSHSFDFKQIIEGEYFPFLQPINRQNSKPQSGIGSYFPFCYSRRASIYFINDHEYPANLFNLTVDCINTELRCPVKQYSSISYTQLPKGSDFNSERINMENKNILNHLATILKSPNIYGPGYYNKCILICKAINDESPTLMFHKTGSAGLIASLAITIITSDGKAFAKDWEGLFLSVYADDHIIPNINVSLSSLFITRGSENEFKGAAFGRMMKTCSYYKEHQYIGRNNHNTGYFHLPIPFWHKIEIILSSFRKKNENLLACYQVLNVENPYDPRDTGYLHSRQISHGGQIENWREVLTVEGGWGQLVSVSADYRNVKHNSKGRFFNMCNAIEVDPVIYVDGSSEPRVKGTGFEDYFSYSHGFTGAENSSFSFVGVPYYYYNTQLMGFNFICYRQHLLDPINFDESLHFVMEGAEEGVFMRGSEPISHQEFLERSLREETVYEFLSFYYFRKHQENYFSNKLCDRLDFGDEASLNNHSFKPDKNAQVFSRKDLKFIGDSKFNKKFEQVQGLTFENGSQFNLTLKLPKVTFDRKLTLTQTFYSAPFSWNSRVEMVLNRIQLGTWFVAMGSTVEEYSLRNQTIVISNHASLIHSHDFYDIFNFEFAPLNDYHIVSLELCSISLN